MNTRRLFLRLVPALLGLASATPAFGLANRVFVSQRSGNDLNSCSNILTPCQTFAGAVVQLNPGGEAIVLDSGGYGAVTITQSVTIEAPPGVLAFIHPSTPIDAVSINASGATVVLRGLTINGAGQTTGSGISVAAVAELHVENCLITGFAGISANNGDGIYFNAAGSLFVKDTITRGNGYVGVYVIAPSGTAQASLDHCRLEQNEIGLLVQPNAQASIQSSVASGNSNCGLYAGGGELNSESCLVANNLIGARTTGTTGFLRASNCTITDNVTGVNPGGGSLLSRSNNTLEGNVVNGSFTGGYTAK